jgi:hypothetical protein
LLLLLGFGLLPGHAAARDNAFVIKSVETRLVNDVYHLDARIDYRFSDEALNALRSGVPLLILLDIQVVQDRWYWDRTLAELEQGYLLLYHALSEQFIIHNLNSGAQEHFRSLGAALRSLGRIDNLPLIDAKLLQPDEAYKVRLRTHLDIESLPAPMRPLAYISSDWQLDSDWVTWPLTR